MNFITLKTFDSSISAHILKSHIEDHGIEVFIFDENIITVNPLLGVAVGGIKVKVEETDFVEAQRILAELDKQPYTDNENEIIHCPSCDSESVYADFISMKSTRGVIAAILSFIFGTYPIYYKRVYKCKSCNHEFKS